MLIIGVTIIRAFSKLLLWTRRRVSWRTSADSPRGSRAVLQDAQGRKVGIGWEPADTHAGLSECQASCRVSCGWGMGGDSYEASAEAEDRSPGCAVVVEASGEDRFRGSGSRMQRIGSAQLLWHWHRWVQMRRRVMKQLPGVARNEGVRRKKALWRPAGRSELESLGLAPGHCDVVETCSTYSTN